LTFKFKNNNNILIIFFAVSMPTQLSRLGHEKWQTELVRRVNLLHLLLSTF